VLSWSSLGVQPGFSVCSRNILRNRRFPSFPLPILTPHVAAAFIGAALFTHANA